MISVDNDRQLTVGTSNRVMLDWRSTWQPLRWALIVAGVALVALNISLLAGEIPNALLARGGGDFRCFLSVAGVANPYAGECYVWSPLIVYPLELVTPIGFRAWQLLMVAPLLLVRPWWVVGVVLLSYPFWFEASNGSVMIAVFAVTWLALNGSRTATVVFLAMALLMPRPLMIPALAYLLWTQRWTLPVFAVLFAVHLGGVMLTGLGDEWIGQLISHGPHQVAVNAWNVSPSRFIGALWLPIGAVLAVVLTLRGYVGLAGLALSPYLMHNYLIFAFLDLRPAARAAPRGSRSPVPRSAQTASLHPIR